MAGDGVALPVSESPLPVTWSILADALSVTLLTVSLTLPPTSDAARPAKSFTSPFTCCTVSDSAIPRHLRRRSS